MSKKSATKRGMREGAKKVITRAGTPNSDTIGDVLKVLLEYKNKTPVSAQVKQKFEGITLPKVQKALEEHRNQILLLNEYTEGRFKENTEEVKQTDKATNATRPATNNKDHQELSDQKDVNETNRRQQKEQHVSGNMVDVNESKRQQEKEQQALGNKNEVDESKSRQDNEQQTLSDKKEVDDLKRRLKEAEGQLEEIKKQRDDSGSTRQNEKNEDMRRTMDQKDRQIEELRNRLSAITAAKITENNPAITDLSDQNRPTKLAEKFKQVYDDEWTHAYEHLSERKLPEDLTLNFLAAVVKEAYELCFGVRKELIDKLVNHIIDDFRHPQGTSQGNSKKAQGKNSRISESKQRDGEKDLLMSRHINPLKKEMAVMSVPSLIEVFKTDKMKGIMKDHKIKQKESKEITEYTDKVVQYVWLMVIQDPPMAIQWQKPGEQSNKDKFAFYTQRGETVDQCIWPAVLLHQDGPLMSKGIIQGKDKAK